MQRPPARHRIRLLPVTIKKPNDQHLLRPLVADPPPPMARRVAREVRLRGVRALCPRRAAIAPRGPAEVRRHHVHGDVIPGREGAGVAERERVPRHALEGPPDGEEGPAGRAGRGGVVLGGGEAGGGEGVFGGDDGGRGGPEGGVVLAEVDSGALGGVVEMDLWGGGGAAGGLGEADELWEAGLQGRGFFWGGSGGWRG